MTKIKATYFISNGNRHYTDTTYIWYEDDSVIVSVVTGDDDWDSYSGTDSDITKTTFDELSEAIQQKLLENIGKE